jgi:hypothetical protein
MNIGKSIAIGAMLVSLGGCATSLASNLNTFAAEEQAVTLAETSATLWAQSGKETAAQARVVEEYRSKIDTALASGRKARDGGDNVLLAQALTVLNEDVPGLSSFLVTNGAPQPQGATQ